MYIHGVHKNKIVLFIIINFSNNALLLESVIFDRPKVTQM